MNMPSVTKSMGQSDLSSAAFPLSAMTAGISSWDGGLFATHLYTDRDAR
jgi:hypothetical protein